MFPNNVISAGRDCVVHLEYRLIKLLIELENTSLMSLELLISGQSFFLPNETGFCAGPREFERR